MRKSPVDLVIETFGGIRATARAVGRTPTAISQWKKSGKIPGPVRLIILLKAKELHAELTSSDLDFGRD